MKLTLSHGDVIAGICAFLSGRGLTGFDPNKVHAEFTKGRDGKLSVVLDDEAPTVFVPSEPKPKPAKADTAVAKTSEALADTDKADAVAAEVPATGPVTAAQEEAQVEVETGAAEVEVATEATTPEEPAGEENLFG